MDPQRLKDVYSRLEALDERLRYKISPRSHSSLAQPTLEQLDARLRDLSTYTLELKSIVRDFCLAFARHPPAAAASAGEDDAGPNQS